MADEQKRSGHASSAAPRQGSRRHRLEGGRSRQVLLRFNDAEYEAIASRASDAGVSVQRFLADGAFAVPRPTVRAPAALMAELAGLRRLTGSLSNNVNQIARWLNSGARPDARVTIALDSVRRAMTRLDAVLAWLGPAQQNAPGPRPDQAEGRSADVERLRPPGTADPRQRSDDPRTRT